MSSFSIIQQKLEQFIKKYYASELIKGAILFFAIGLLYFFITLLIEYFLWLNPLGRTVLFWLFVGVETALFVRFIVFPLVKLFNLQKGISQEDASKIIGNHFPEVSDKLLNVIQLNQNQRESELLQASIEQKSSQLQPIPFKRAVNFKTNVKYLKYAAIPVILFLLFRALGDKDAISKSYERVVHYDTAYEAPAPFIFYVLNENLNAIENKNYTLKVKTQGEIVPENASITFNYETYYLQQTKPGNFEFTFQQPTEAVKFNLQANKVSSKEYELQVIKTPSLLSFEMVLDYPAYTKKKDEVYKSTGNATIPEGTRVKWNLNTQNTNQVALKLKDTSFVFSKNSTNFTYQKRIYSKLDYAVTTSNKDLKEYENLSYSLAVIKDQYPQIKVESKQDSTKQDSTKQEIVYFLGNVSDDYGISKLQIVYFSEENNIQKSTKNISISRSNVGQFVYTFPGDIEVEEGVNYEYYFEVFDNDAIHNYKSTQSNTFSFRKLTKEELENQLLNNQNESIKGLDSSLEKFKEQEKTLEEIAKNQKEKKKLNYNDKKKLEKFIKQQQQQEQMMKNFSKELKENLENFQPEDKRKELFKQQLKERIGENEEQLKENEKLLDELEKLQEKIQKEELSEKLEKLAKQNKSQEKSLEQLLELTKRYYVTKKAEKLNEELFELGKEQEKLADAPEDENTKEAQENLNEKFEEYKKELEELQKENKELKEPMDIPQDKSGEKQVEEEQQKASDNLEQNKKQEAGESQKKAGKKMQEMSMQMQAQMEASSGETLEEDSKMLRQILDNLVVFSFEQEALMNNFKSIDYGNAIFGKKLTKQHELKLNFQHIDDSLFILALRQPLISEKINQSLSNIEFNIDKSLERLAENNKNKGVSSQQYTVTGANDLAVLLSDLMSNMQAQMAMGSGKGGKGKGQGKGQGQGEGFQLSDIIKKQESLSEKMKEGSSGKGEKKGKGKGEKGEGEGKNGEGEGEGQGEGEGNGEGEGEGKEGKNGKEGKDGEGEGDSEQMNGEIYEIYKEQQMLRQQLEDRLRENGLLGEGNKLLRDMEKIEQQLLDKGFDQRTLERMLNLNYEFLKLDKATFQQGQDTKRESKTNRSTFQNKKPLLAEDILKYFNTTEILNREALPLKQEYKQKVQEYFKQNND